MEKLLTHCLVIVVTVTFKTAGQSPPWPLLCLPRRRLGRAPEPASGCPGRARAARGEPGAEGSASGWRGAPGGQRIPAPGRVSPFSGPRKQQ